MTSERPLPFQECEAALDRPADGANQSNLNDPRQGPDIAERYHRGQSKGWSVSGSVVEQHSVRVRFAVYGPPAPGLPWLSVRLGPNDEVIGVKPFDSAEAALAKNESSANRLASKFENAEIQRLERFPRSLSRCGGVSVDP